MRVAEILLNGLGDHGADAGHIGEIRRAGGEERVHARVPSHQGLCGHRSNVADAEREQHPRERPLFGLRDGGEHLVGALRLDDHRLAVVSLACLGAEERQGDDLAGLEPHKVIALEAVQIGDVLDETLGVQQHDRLLADAVDVHGALAHEMLDALDELRRAGAVGAAHGDLTRLAHGLRAAGGAHARHGPLRQGGVALRTAGTPSVRLLRLPRLDRPDDLRDHVTGTLQDHVVAGADVLAADVVLVVQRRALHRDAPDEDRREHGEGREHAGPPHVDLDAAQARRHRRGRELEGDGPARVVGDAAERPLHGVSVDLDHGAVDVVVELAAPVFPGAARRGDLFDAVDHDDARIDLEAGRAEPVEHAVVVGQVEALRVADGIAPDVERPLRGEPGVQLADGPGGGIARVHERAEPGREPLLVEAREGGEPQVDLAAHLHHGRRIGDAQPQRQRADGPQVGGHVLPHLAVAARGAHGEDAALVRERDRKAVDLGLDGIA